MTVTTNPLRPTEYRFTGLFLQVGRDHIPDTPGGCVTDRRGHACAVVGYDLDLERDAPLTLLVRFADGFETHVFPEEVDDHAPYRAENPTVLEAPRGADVPGTPRGCVTERFKQARELRERIVAARVARHEALLFGDKFDGTPNSDHRAGEEVALRSYAEAFGFEAPSEAEVLAISLARLEDANPESDIIAEFARALRATGEAGEIWEGRG